MISDNIKSIKNRILDTYDNIGDQINQSKVIAKRKTIATIESRISVGRVIRDKIAILESIFGPIVKFFLPNFIHFHYFYIITSGIICSILLYGPKNMKYIDCFFMSYAAVSQAGLNTVDLNKLSLYQQLVIYFICTLTTPIFIHSMLVFVRIYWFEREIDDIKRSSKLNFKMRRQATLAARTTSLHNGPIDQENDTPIKKIISRLGRSRSTYQKQDKEDSSSNSSQDPNAIPMQNIEKHEVQSPTQPINASDMYMSIAMMREKNRSHDADNDDQEGPAYVVGAPAEREHRIHKMKKNLHRRALLRQDSAWKRALSRHRKGKDFVDGDGVEAEGDDGDDDGDDDDDEEEVMNGNNKRQQSDDNDDEESILVANTSASEETRNNDEEAEEAEEDFDEENNEESETDESVRNKSISNGEEDGNAEGNIENVSNIEKNSIDNHDIGNRAEADDLSSPLKSQHLTFSDVHRELKTTFQDNKPMRPKIQQRKSSFAKIPHGLRKVSRYPSMMLEDLSAVESRASHGIKRQNSAAYLSFNPTFGRNSTFVPSNQNEKDELGGVEYRSLKLLANVLIFYYIGFHVLALMVYCFWTITSAHYNEIMRSDGIAPAWWGAFTSASCFNDLGFTLTPNSFFSFATSRYIVLWSCFFIIIGNVGFPIMLRMIIWIMHKFARDLSLFKESLEFLLDHPRRCFTLLFPSIPTWWLLFVLVLLNVIDVVLFCILDIHDKSLDYMANSTKVMSSFFQAVSTRTAGFSVLDLSQLHPAIQVSYMLMMYVSALPLAISIRRTNVYEEQSLGIYLNPEDDEFDADNSSTESSSTIRHKTNKTTRYIGSHLRRQLSFDLWYIFLGLFIICIAESRKLRSLDDPYFTIFQVLFEVVSAYGCVGLSLGYPNDNRSFSAQFNVVSKLVIVAMFIRGRHRGLPYSIDRAIILHSKAMEKRDYFSANRAKRVLTGAQDHESSVLSPNLERWNNYHTKQKEDRQPGIDDVLADESLGIVEEPSGVIDEEAGNGLFEPERPAAPRRNTITFDNTEHPAHRND